jgi:RNA polymerase sigma-70 factor (ECF subfamily)
VPYLRQGWAVGNRASPPKQSRLQALLCHVLECNEIVEPNITRLLVEWRQGNQAALDALLPLVYDELHRIASRQMARERQGHTLQATALVHEAWIQLANAANLELKDRAHFLALAARLMRQILVQYARGHNCEKRGGGAPRLELVEALDAGASPAPSTPGDCDLLTLDHAMTKLAAEDERKSRIIELKYFGGLTNDEIAEVVGIAAITVRRDLQVAHAFLQWQMSGDPGVLGAGPDSRPSAQ